MPRPERGASMWLWWILTPGALGLSCAEEAEPRARWLESEWVFEGKVEHVETTSESREDQVPRFLQGLATVTPTRWWKGSEKRDVVLVDVSAPCGTWTREGNTYVFYAVRDRDGNLLVKASSHSSADLAGHLRGLEARGEDPTRTVGPLPRGKGEIRLARNDFDEAWLVGEDGRMPFGVLPAGTYTMKGRLDGSAFHAGEVAVQDGQRLHLRCDAMFRKCVGGPVITP